MSFTNDITYKGWNLHVLADWQEGNDDKTNFDRDFDGLSDGLLETYDLSLPLPAPGEHSVVVRTVDAAGNAGTGRTVVDVR